MGLGALATIGAQRPQNLSVVVLDNGRYGETGMQESHTSHGTSLAKVALACGFDWAEEIASADGVRALAGASAPGAAVASRRSSCAPRPCRARFRAATAI